MAALSTSPYIDPDFIVQGSAEGPLKGLTFAVKDLFDVSPYSHALRMFK